MRSCLKGPRGFTLLEILIAIFILGTVLSTIFASYTGTFRVIQETEARTDVYAMARVAMSRMQEDLESAYVYPQQTFDEDLPQTEEGQFVGEDKTLEGNDADGLRFLSTAQILLNEEDKDSGLTEIRYYVKEDEDTEEGLVLYRSDTPELQERPEPDTGGAVLCEGLSAVRFTYRDREGSEYDSWDSSVQRDTRLPAMVSILLEFHNKSQPEVPFRFMGGAAIPMAGERHHGE